MVNGLNGPVNITNGLGEGSITLNIQNHLTPCTITSFADHFDIQPLGNGADANGANTGELADF